MFKKGEKVYSILKGWGEVIDDDYNSAYKLYVQFKKDGGSFTQDGKSRINDLIPELYHTEPVITVPKRRFEHTGWVHVANHKDGDLTRLIGRYIFDTKDSLDKVYSDKECYTKQQITYYTEE